MGNCGKRIEILSQPAPDGAVVYFFVESRTKKIVGGIWEVSGFTCGRTDFITYSNSVREKSKRDEFIETPLGGGAVNRQTSHTLEIHFRQNLILKLILRACVRDITTTPNPRWAKGTPLRLSLNSVNWVLRFSLIIKCEERGKKARQKGGNVLQYGSA